MGKESSREWRQIHSFVQREFGQLFTTVYVTNECISAVLNDKAFYMIALFNGGVCMCMYVCNFVCFMGYACWHCPAALTDLGYRRAAVKLSRIPPVFILQLQRGATGIGWTRPDHFLPTLTFPYSTSFPFTPFPHKVHTKGWNEKDHSWFSLQFPCNAISLACQLGYFWMHVHQSSGRTLPKIAWATDYT